MIYDLSDTRQPLAENTVVDVDENHKYVIDRLAGSGGFSLMYIAHLAGTSRYVALKELFPRNVENGIAERREDGRIVIYDPMTPASALDDAAAWKELTGYFEREVKLTQKAARVFDEEGNGESQNSPDVWGISGPFRDSKGNLYIAEDTAQGEPLEDLIRSGFVTDRNGEVLINGNLEDILNILKETARLLDKLHGDNHMFHLDISPYNIYVVNAGAGTRMSPHIIDYGSAYDRADEGEKTAHRFTCNPFSPPEIKALAELNDQDAGYKPDASSDTYAVASILFYAVTGQIYTVKSMFDQRWRERICEEYDPSWYGADLKDSFVGKLIAVLEKGLRADQNARYKTAKELYDDLSDLQKAFRTSGDLLSKIDEDERMSYAILDKYPLYDYRSASGDMDILCLGCGTFVRRMIFSMMSCGQMIGSHLNIHVVSQEAEDQFKNTLLAQAPALDKYSNLVRSGNEYEYVTFIYESVTDLLQPETCERIAAAYSPCRYTVISLGRNKDNIDLAHRYAKCLSKNRTASADRSVIHYYTSEDAARNVRSEVDKKDISDMVELAPFGSGAKGYAAAVRALGRQALRINYLYDKLGNPRAALADTARKFVDDPYSQRSSCASALHLRYKLASVGIDPSQDADIGDIVSEYLRVVAGTKRDELVILEHRRWMMYMIADGYREPSLEQIRKYAFRRGADEKFNASFKDTANKLHHCLVPCTTGINLPRSHKEWDDQYGSYEEIDATGYDLLDKMSLKVHLLARERIEATASKKELLDDLHNMIGAPLERKEAEMAELAKKNLAADSKDAEGVGDLSSALDRPRKRYDRVYKALENMADSGEYNGELDEIALLEQDYAECGIGAAAGFRTLREDIAIYIEFSRYRDYKAPDAQIIDNLLWLLYADEELTLIKTNGQTVSDNIAGPLVLEPKRLLYVGKEYDEELVEFLRGHGNRDNIQFIPRNEENTDSVFRSLENLCSRVSGKCVVDVTGSDEMYIAAAVLIAQENKNVSVVRCNAGTQRVENIIGFDRAGAYQLNTCLSAEEVYALYGAKSEPANNQYMLRLSHIADDMWELYQDFHGDWEALTAYFYRFGSSPELLFNVYRSNTRDTEWRTFSVFTDMAPWGSLKLKECFFQLEQAGFIRNLTAASRGSFGVKLSFQYPGDAGQPQNKDYIFNRCKELFTWKMRYALAPFKLTVTSNGDVGKDTVSIESGSYSNRYDKDGIDFSDRRLKGNGSWKRFQYKQIIPALKRMQELGLICELSTSDDMGKAPVNIQFAYTDLAVKDCLMTSGNVLELYAWNMARQTGYFDDCRANLTFHWKEGAKNELDLILTKGLTTLVVSCKTAKFNKAHLYEIKYLAERFSLNSKAVIVYSSRQAVDEREHLTYDLSAVKDRAKAMGVYLIDTNELEAGQLGEEFVKIAKGEDVML